LTARGLRAEVDTADAQMGAKIRRHQVEKVPYQLVVGDAEVADGTVSVRTRSGDQRKGVPLDEFAEDLVWEVSARGRASSRRAAGDGDLSR
jgi:threonyl-tRNA synthetase